MSQSCGHLFCATCWTAVEWKESRGDRSRNVLKSTCCPICQSPTEKVAPILPFLAKEAQARNWSIYSRGSGELKNDICILNGQQHEKNVHISGQNCNQLEQQLGTLLSMIHQFTDGNIHQTVLDENDVKPSNHDDKWPSGKRDIISNDSANTENDNLQKDREVSRQYDNTKSNNIIEPQHIESRGRFNESEIPGTCLSLLPPFHYDQKLARLSTVCSRRPIDDHKTQSQQSRFGTGRQGTTSSEVSGTMLDTLTTETTESKVLGTLLPFETDAHTLKKNSREICHRHSNEFLQNSEVGDDAVIRDRYDQNDSLSNEHDSMELSTGDKSVDYGRFDRQMFQDDIGESEVPGTFSHRYEKKMIEKISMRQTQPDMEYDTANGDGRLKCSFSQRIRFSDDDESPDIDFDEPESKLPESEVPGTLVDPHRDRFKQEPMNNYYSNQSEIRQDPLNDFKCADHGTPKGPRKAQIDNISVNPASPSTQCKRDDVCHNSNAENSSSYVSSSKRTIIFGAIRPWNHRADSVRLRSTCNMHDVNELGGNGHTSDIQENEASCHGSLSGLTSNTRHQKIMTSVVTRSLPCLSPICRAKSIPYLYIAFDILDSVEANSLKALHDQGLCRIVNGVHELPFIEQYDTSNESNRQLTLAPKFRPFPAILVTHAIDKPTVDAGGDANVRLYCHLFQYHLSFMQVLYLITSTNCILPGK